MCPAECPAEFKSKHRSREDEVKKYLTKSGQVTVSGLARLRGDLKMSKNKYRMALAKVESTQMLAYHLEDLVEAKEKNTGIHWSWSNSPATDWENKWFLVYKPLCFKFFAVVAFVLSFFSFLGAISSMHGVDVSSSVYFLAVHSPQATAAGVVIFIFFSLGYASYITMWAMFQIRLPGLMELVPYSTSPEGLSFNVRMCCRFAAPLAFFYLGWIAESGLKSGSWIYNQAPIYATSQNITVLRNVTKQVMMPVSLSRHLADVTPEYTTRIMSESVHVGIQNATWQTVNVTVLEAVNITVHNSTRPIRMFSSFSNFYQLQNVPAINSAFGTAFPVILLIMVPLFIANAFNRLFVMLKWSGFQFGTGIIAIIVL